MRSINKGITLVGHMTYALANKQDPNTVLKWMEAERDGDSPRFRAEAYDRVLAIYDQKASSAGFSRIKGRYQRTKVIAVARGQRDVFKPITKKTRK